MKHISLFAIVAFFFIPTSFASAHQPYLIYGEKQISVDQPEISKAYYGEFNGSPVVFTIKSDKDFKLYAGVLVPTIAGSDEDVMAVITYNDKQIALLNKPAPEWTRMYEPFGGDNYFQGPEWRGNATSGVYTITVSRPGNIGKYVLAVGETESFTFDETLRTIRILPALKSEFFGEPAWTAYFNRIGLFMVLGFLAIVIILLIFGEILKMIARIVRRIFGISKPVRD